MHSKLAALIVCALIGASCGGKKDRDPVSSLADEFVRTALALTPVSATQAGYHKHGRVALDELLDDFSPAGVEDRRQFYRGIRARVDTALKAPDLPAEDRADCAIMSGEIALNLLELEEIRAYRHNPTLYVELVGNGLFTPYVLDYAPKADRFRHIIRRMEKIPALLDQARTNLVASPDVWIKVALEENDGNIALVERTLSAEVPRELRPDYDRAAAAALDALRAFNDYLATDLAMRDAQRDWRLGASAYSRKFQHALQTDLTPRQVLAAAEADMEAVRTRMFELAQQVAPASRGNENVVISKALDRIAARHATPGTYVKEAGGDLEEARRFVRDSGIVPLPSRDNLKVIETPEFMRGIYAVGGFAPAPALEPKLGAFYWLTPIPPDWPVRRVESKLREYNFYKLKLLTIHEAIPGHYLQFEYANGVQPHTRRVLRSVYGSGPYIEGWAQYATQTMLDAGFLDNSPELRLTFLKEELRVLANAILDIRLHTMDMTDEEALDLMQTQAFQEREEAEAKLQRAKLSSCQLPTYFVGWRDWIRVREAYQKTRGAHHRLSEFHLRALQAGAVPMRSLEALLAEVQPGQLAAK